MVYETIALPLSYVGLKCLIGSGPSSRDPEQDKNDSPLCRRLPSLLGNPLELFLHNLLGLDPILKHALLREFFF